jgi:DNA-binding transcriptional LysR family regulator
MDKLTSMKVFAAVARLGSFTAAAEELGISRAMASKYMNYLENNLDVRLLNRTTRQLSLTEVGSTYQERINNILAEIEETEQAITQLQTEPRGTLKIMAPPSFGSFHLARILGRYKDRYPRVVIEMILTDRAPDLFEEGLDLAIWIGELEDSDLIARKLATSRNVVCGSPEYFVRNGIPQTPADLEQYNCLTFSTRTPFSDWKFMINGKLTTLHPTGTFRSNSADPLRIAAINNCGLVQLPSYIVGLDIQSGHLQPVLKKYEPEPLVINAVYIHRRHLSTKARTFVDFISEQFQPVPYWEKWIEEN